ncbi:Protein HOL1 [Escovopsis weberi]|uniref:Protein HOL1 n=1 Tax=Escovopsis weberi TaxID=150374 RepID=A0A0M8MWJ7_ESCWE|nr:Protein HOL1 [Escovopsis weberi]
MAPEEAAQTPWWSRGNHNDSERKYPTWSMGILNDKHTLEVPGSVLLLASDRNEPLGMRNVPSRVSHSSLPVGLPFEAPSTPGENSQPATPRRARSPAQRGRQPEVKKEDEKKRTADGAIILDPQPEDSANDPLNWPSWRRDTALLSLGFYCMLGGGMTPVIAAGFTNVADDFNVSVETVALTTGLYMMGLGLGSVFASPTAIIFGKRPVYLASAVLFIGASLWAGFSPSFPSLLAARIIQGVAISPVECLPSATIAEIFFLHERAYRIGIYTLLLLGGKNLVPLVSATIIGQFGWRWVFFIVAMIVGFAGVLLFLFVPETFWDRTPVKRPSRSMSLLRRLSFRAEDRHEQPHPADPVVFPARHGDAQPPSPGLAQRQRGLHVGFVPRSESIGAGSAKPSVSLRETAETQEKMSLDSSQRSPMDLSNSSEHDTIQGKVSPDAPIIAKVQNDSDEKKKEKADFIDSDEIHVATGSSETVRHLSMLPPAHTDLERSTRYSSIDLGQTYSYTHTLRHRPAQTFVQQLRPFHGRLNTDNWLKVMARPFVLFAYPAVLWSAIVYACSIGWLIVMSETLAIIYRDPATYNFTALQTGLVYISPFIGGILGTGVAGKVSDIIVRAMARRNGGLYEPEYRLVMAIPILITTSAGLIGFGWAAEEKDAWIVPTIFFGIVSFGCSLGSTTSITFCVDSYRQYAGEALVTLNFSKNILHGLVFSLFFSKWMHRDGPKTVYIWLGVIQAATCIMSIPMYIFGKRARMWTVRMNLMEKF